MKRFIEEIIIHCADTPNYNSRYVRKHGTGCYTAKDIEKWHLERGFRKIGYHYVIEYYGGLVQGRLLNEVGAHCFGRNENSIGICLLGRDEYAVDQLRCLEHTIKKLRAIVGNVPVRFHSDYSSKSCPGLSEEYKYHLNNNII